MYTLLLVDDEAEIRKSIAETVDFESVGFRLIGEAENGLEALELVERLTPDLVLSDIKMPYMSGMDLAAAIREIHPSVSVAFLTGYDDFQYARQAVEYNILSYILKPVTSGELLLQIKKIKSRLDTRFGELTDHKRLDAEAENKQLKKELALMSVALDERFAVTDKEIVFLEETLRDLGLTAPSAEKKRYIVMLTRQAGSGGENKIPGARFVDGIVRKYFPSQSFVSGEVVFTLLYADRNAYQKYLSSAVREIAETAEKYFGCKTGSGLSAAFSAPKHINRAYKEAQVALKNLESEEADFKEISYISDIEKTDNHSDYGFAAEMGGYVEQLLKAGTRPELETYLAKNVEKAIAKNIDLGLLTMHIMMAIYRSVKIVTDDNPPADIFQNNLFDEALKKFGVEKTGDSMETLCLKAKDFIEEKRRSGARQLVEKAVGMIEERFSDPALTLQTLSEELYCSVPYLSTLIKRTYGNSFINLLTQKRMEKAKQLILGSGMKMSEICVRCGYVEQHYFSYCFKKHFGISPLKMRDAKISAAPLS